MKNAHHVPPALRFIAPVMLENALTILIGLVFSSLIGGISSSALAAIGMSNSIIAMLTALFSMLTTGSAVLTARLIGAGEREEASRTIEQSALMAIVLSAAASLLCFLLAAPLLGLLMPSAEKQLFDETVVCFRVMLLSVPPMTLHGVLASIMRASGDGKRPMYIAAILNLVQIFCAWLFISVLKLDMIGAGLAYVVCRLAGTAIAFGAILRGSDNYHVSLRAMLRPHFPTCARIMRIGVPTSIESLFVNFGYLLANTMTVGLGTVAASAYQVANTLNTFNGFPQTICATIGVTFVGQQIGAKQFSKARKTGWIIYACGMISTLLICSTIAFCGRPLTALYSSDPEVLSQARLMLWMLFIQNIPAVSINTVDPQLRAGGNSKFVMTFTVLVVWLVRIPLTWLLAYYFKLGLIGVYIANIVSLFVRAIIGMICYIGNKWMYKKV